MKQIEDSHMQQESASESHTHHRRRKYNLVNFTKMHGLGNDFMVIESMTQKVNLTPELIRSWSDRHTGIGFDQLLLLSAPETQGADFQYSILIVMVLKQVNAVMVLVQLPALLLIKS